eukprot:TRINITY_DN17777_c0_g1_i2.p3 TRINITY_DN17777_c0_g1~~TRINITY_DN17777_c0_g1_i2.p3  ORF type:complete len:119 (+),score=42.83 TRINITY_DN17777_c0_g1_i2:96-452(+)
MFFFFFKQKTAYEMQRGLVGSEMCIRDSLYCGLRHDNKNLTRYRLTEAQLLDFAKKAVNYGYKTIVLQGGEDDYFTADKMISIITVSYTHLTLPTILLVQISVVAVSLKKKKRYYEDQ